MFRYSGNKRSRTAVYEFIPAVILLIIALRLACMGVHAQSHVGGSQTNDSNWSEFLASMEKMHMAMGAVERSGKSDIDFVRLMIPHHQGAIDMAKAELLYGKDPVMRRLAQEILVDQQSEIDAMQLWLERNAVGNLKKEK